jgi:DNA-binding NarL/FixJ family response regulator
MPRVLVIDNDQAHSTEIADRLRALHLTVVAFRELSTGSSILHDELSACDIVVVNVSDASQPWLAILRRLLEASARHSSQPAPLFLCTSRIKRDPQFQLELERMGVRFVYER